MRRTLTLILSVSFILSWMSTPVPAEGFRPDFTTGLELKYLDSAVSKIDSNGNLIETEPDFVLEPYLVLRLKKKDPLYSQKLALSLSYDRYLDHAELNYPSYDLFFEQGLGKRSYLTMKYSLIPYLVVGGEEVPLNGSGPNFIDSGLNYRLQTFFLGLDKDFSNRLNIYFYGKEILKDYNLPMEYRSAIANILGGDFAFHLDRLTRLQLGFSYEINESRKGVAAGATYIDDTDYVSPGFAFKILRHLNDRDTFRLNYLFKLRHFTTLDPNEGLHFARNDRIHEIRLSNSYQFRPQWGWVISYEHFRRDSDHPTATSIENSLSTGVDFLFQ
jgi:hypothetical protein